MPASSPLSGVYAAALTPLTTDYAVDYGAFPALLDFLARRGAHGALLFGTTGEGPSFSPEERIEACKQALAVRQAHPGFRLLLGTGLPSLEETVTLTRAAFDLGLDGTVTLPPYYFRKATDEGLFAWFAEVIRRSVPEGGAFMAYHIPSVSGVGVSPDLIARLKDAFPRRFAGLKDSSADPVLGRLLGERFGADLTIFTGTDPLLLGALQAGASGSITAAANLASPDLRRVYDAHQRGATDPEAQSRIESLRTLLDHYPPASATLKALLHRAHNFPRYVVRPPLLPLDRELEDKAVEEFRTAGLI